MEEMEVSQIEKINRIANVKFYESIRKNHSAQADEVIKKIKNGETTRESDYITLLTDDQKTIDSAIMFDDIQERIAHGRVTHEDIDYLLDMMGDIGELDQVMRKAFYAKADEINFTYAISHQDEFTEEELVELRKKVQGKSSRLVLKEELERL